MEKQYKTDILVIGGGIAGASLTYYLSLQKKSIILVDRGLIGSEASGLSAGTINRGTARIRKLHDQGYRFGMEKCLTIVCAKKAQDLLPIPRNAYLVSGNKNIAKLEPELLGGTCQAALVYRNSLVVDPGELTRAFVKASHSNTIVLENTEITKIDKIDHGFRATSRDNKTVIYCEKLALCPGAWSKEAGEMVGYNLPIEPVKGQVWVTEHPTPLRNIIYAHSSYTGPTHTVDRRPIWKNLYGRHLPDGRALFGGARLPVRNRNELYNVEEEHLNMDHVYELLPNMNKYGVLGGWAGPMPFGPMIAKEIFHNCWVITGLGSHGFKDGPRLAEKIANDICAKPKQ